MSKVKSDKTPHYELLYLVSNKYSEAELESIKEKVNKLITNLEGIITYQEDMGKRRLAYPINGFRYGYYQLLEFDLAGAKYAEMEKNLKLDHEVMRHQIVKRSLRSAEQIATDAKALGERIAVVNPPASEEVVETIEVVPEAPVAIEAVETVEAETVVPKMSPEELDNKLDKILDSEELYK